jgi:SagB-type dehydrogenase family enzyme
MKELPFRACKVITSMIWRRGGSVMSEGIGDRYQRETRYTPEGIAGFGLDWSRKPPVYKDYAGAKKIALPNPRATRTPSFGELLLARHSVRDFADRALPLSDLSFLLWASNGIRAERRGHGFRTVPSAGALYPIESYIVANNVEGLAPGIYHHSIESHCLEEVKEGDFRQEVTDAALGQEMCAAAPAVIIWTAIWMRSKWKYHERAYRYIYVDAGHIAQNLALAACSLELGSCQVGAFFDDFMNELIGLQGDEESVIYLSAVGHPRM